MRTLLGRGSIYTVAATLQLSGAVLSVPILTRLLTPDGYGVVAVALVTQMLFALVAAVGFPDTLPAIFFRSQAGRQGAQAAIATTIPFAVAIVFLAEATGPWWSGSLLDLAYDWPLRLAVLGSIPLAVILAAQAVLRADDRAGRFVLVTALSAVGTQAFGLCFAAIWRTPSAFLLGYAVGLVLAVIVAVTSTGIHRRGIHDVALMRANLQVSLPAVPHAVALYILWAGDRAVLSRLEGPEAAGRYQLAYLVGGMTIALVSSVYNAWAPIIFRAPENRRWSALAETGDALFRLTALIAGLSAIAAPAVLLIAVPDSYDPAGLAAVSAIIPLAVIPFVAFAGNLNVILWHGKTVVMAWATPLTAVINVGLNLALIPVFGLAGAAVATVLSYCVLALLIRRAARRLVRVPWRRGSVARAWVISGVLVAAAAIVPAGGVWLVPRLLVLVLLLAWTLGEARRLMRAPARLAPST